MNNSATIIVQQPAVDSQHPWPGLSAFTEELHGFFHGRDRESGDLYRRVRRKLFTVLFGQSGLGKTSLLQAGLFPLLRREGFLPVSLRIDYGAIAPAPAVQVKAAVARALEALNLTGATRPAPEETLWEYFHRRDLRLESREGEKVVSLVLVFDQFEELFTLGQSGAESRVRLPAFLSELADLIENRAPVELARRFEDNPELVESFVYDRQNYRVLFCLREDYLAHLESLRERIPSVAQNRIRLTGMNGSQALQAVLGPGAGLVVEEVGRQIVRFVAGSPARENTTGQVQSAPDDLEALAVEPSLLSLVCRELNDRRLALGLPGITADLLCGSCERILQDFYERAVGDQPPAVRAFIEEELLTDSGARESMAVERARKDLRERGAPPSAVDELVKRRLLHLEERLGMQRVELTHDVLTDVVKKSRDKRQRQETAQRAEQREQEVRRQLRRSRRRLAYSMGLAVFFAALSAVAFYFWQAADAALKEADRQKARAVKGEKDANAQKEIALAATKKAEDDEKEARKQRELAEATQALMEDFEDGLYKQSANSPPLLAMFGLALQTNVKQLDETLKQDPENVEALQRKTLNLAQSADVAQKQKKPTEALRFGELSLQEARVLGARTGDAASLRCAVATYGMIAATYKSLGKLPEAMDVCDTAIIIAGRLDPAQESRVTYWRSALYETRGQILVAQKRLPEALDAYHSSLALTEDATVDKDDPKVRGLVASIYIEIGDFLLDQGKKHDALDAFVKARDIRVAMWKTSDGIDASRNMAVSFERVGDVCKALGDYEGARQAYDKNMRARKALIPSKAPSELAYDMEEANYNLSVAFRRIGGLELALGDPWKAEDSYRSSRDIGAEELGQRNAPVKYQQELSYAYLGLGNAARKQDRLAMPLFGASVAASMGSPVGQGLFLPPSVLIPQKTKNASNDVAEYNYQQGLKTIQAAAKKEPDNDDLQDDLALCYGKLGETDIDLGRSPEAVDAYRRRAAIRRSLAKKRNTDEARSDLVGDLGGLAFALLFANQASEAIAAAKEALEIDPKQVWIQTNLAHGYLFGGRFKEAKAIYLKYKDVKVLGEQTFAQAVLDDFRRFREQRVARPDTEKDMEKIEELLKQAP